MTVVHPSMVIHWNTVSMAKKMLSNPMMPNLGPSQPDLHSDWLAGHRKPPPPIPRVPLCMLSKAQGVSSSSPTRSHSPADRSPCTRSQTQCWENVCNITKNVKSHVFWIFKKKNVKNVKKRNHLVMRPLITQITGSRYGYKSRSPTSSILLRSVDTRIMQLRTVCDKCL